MGFWLSFYLNVTLFHMGGAIMAPTTMNLSTISTGTGQDSPKFMTFNIWLIPSKLFLEFFFEIFKKLNVQNFRGSSSMSWKIEKIEKNPFFFKKSYFFWLNLFCIHSQLSFEVHNCSSKFEILIIFGLKNFIFYFRHSMAYSAQTILHKGLILVSMETKTSKYSSENNFWVLSWLFTNL